MNDDQVLRQQLLALLEGHNAHASFEDVAAGFPLKVVYRRPPGFPYSPWALLEHMRLAQLDILEFVRDPHYHSPEWPEGYWPADSQQPEAAAWQRSLEGFRRDLSAVKAIVSDLQVDLTAELPHAPGYTYLREVLLVADHNAYHLGELGVLGTLLERG